MIRVFTNRPGDWVSILDQVITKIKKIKYLMPSCKILGIISGFSFIV